MADDASQVEEDDDGGGTASSAAYTSAQLPGLSREDKRIAYHGVPGAFGEAAALLACPDWQAIPCNGFEVVFQAISEYVVDRGVLPIENSIAGSLHTVYDLMLRYKLHIVGEVTMQIRHNLVAPKGVTKGKVKRVVSHPQALAQCDGYLRQMGATREEATDTATAAESLQGRRASNAAAIASLKAAELYGLDVLEQDIQDLDDNVTRYVVLARDPVLLALKNGEEKHKTSIIFSLNDGPGVLFKVLSVFSLRDIDVTKIESRPMRSDPLLHACYDAELGRRYNYIFYIDFIGSLSDETCQNALRHLKEFAPFLRVLGSYPLLEVDVPSGAAEDAS